MPLLSCENIKKSFDGEEILEDISVSVEEGRILSIIGPSGSGKSTFLRCATGLETIDSGRITYDGMTYAHTVDGKVQYAEGQEKKKISSIFGLVFQSFNLFPHMSVMENITDAPVRVQKRDVKEIREEAEWLNNIVDNILSITRFENQVGQIHKEPEIIEEIIEEAIYKFRRQFSADKIEIKLSLPEEILIVPMDAMLIEQVLINLMLNAVNHGGEVGTIFLVVEAAESAVRIRVADDGQGIAADLLPVLFEDARLYQEWNAGGDANRFMGIGLSVCKTILQAHGGTITASNLPGGGAEFSFALPVEKA